MFLMHVTWTLLHLSDFHDRIIFEGGIFGSTRNIWGNHYLSSTATLFDMHIQLEDIVVR